NMTHNYLKYCDSKAVIFKVPDGGIDLQEKCENISYVMQLKHTINPERYPITGEQIYSFYGDYTLTYRDSNFIGIFLTNGRYSNNAELEAKKCHKKIYLCTIENLYSTLFNINEKNIKKKDNEINDNDIIIENRNITNYSFS